MLTKIHRWLAVHPSGALALVILAALLPFLAKPCNLDDPLFVWAARQIHAHPANPYGFEVNWYGTLAPMSEVTKNPPLACYYLAAAAWTLGWSEVAMHGACLLPALAVILGTHRLAGHFCGRPAFAAWITLLTPAFLVASTTLMSDVLMLAFWVWAVTLWVEAMNRTSSWRFPAAGLLITLAALTKYYGICLLPLLAAYTLLSKRRSRAWLLSLLIPITALGAYHWASRVLYGRTLLSDAAAYATVPQDLSALLSLKLGASFTALSFTGGCLAVAALFAPLIWRPRALAVFSAATILLAGILLFAGVILKDYGPLQGTSRLFLELQMTVWALGGVSVLALAVMDVWQARDAPAWLLGLWVLGTFLFAAVFNWTINGRTILPMAPAVGILLARRLERNARAGWNPPSTARFTGLALGGLLAFLVARADFLFAVAARECAHQTFLKYGRGPRRFWFQGHWGFQYYLAALGASALDGPRTELKRGDLIATPPNNTNLLPLKPELAVVREILTVPGPRLLTTMKGEVGAGFYASLRGPLPFAFGWAPPETVVVLALDPGGPEPAPR